MTDQEIIRRAVDKASKNGYTGWKSFVPAFPLLKVRSKKKLEELIGAMLFLNKEKIIFSHAFAKAFWGEKLVCPNCGGGIEGKLGNFQCQNCAECWNNGEKNWRHHLQKIITEKSILKYLEKHL